MPRPSTFTKEELFKIYWLVNEAPEHIRETTYSLAKKDPLGRNQSTFSRAIQKAIQMLSDPLIRSEYEKLKQTFEEPPYFYKINIEKARQGILEIESPYPQVVSWAKRLYARSKYKLKAIRNIRARLSLGNKVWLMLKKKDPSRWDEKDHENVLASVSEGSKFNYSVTMRTFSPILKDIDNLTLGLKPPPRKIPIIATAEFPSFFQRIIQTCKQLAQNEREKDEIELILLTKATTGMRTGSRRFETGLWGTRIAEGLSPLQIINDDFTWEVLEKKDEKWTINFKPNPFKSCLLRFVKKYGLKKGDYLISISDERANALLKQACELLKVTPLTLHDLRKVYVSYLVRSGFPLEKAIKINVGWTDIGTAYKHYLEFELLAEDIEPKKRKFESLLFG